MATQEKAQNSSEEGANEMPATSNVVAQSGLLTGRRLAIVFAAMLLASLLNALDQTILAALPRIASDFDAFSLQGWVSDSYILAQTVFLLVHGKLLRIFPAKWVLVSGIILFEVGSLVCGVAQNVEQLIAGRIVSGIGAAAIFVAMIQVLSQSTHLEDRPRLFGMFGAVFAFASVIGPLIGGALTDKVTWRWCFLINLPIGGLSLGVVLLSLPAEPPLGSNPTTRSPRAILTQVLYIDVFGAVLFAAAVTCLVLALQWGGNTKAWNDAGVISCFVVSGVTTIGFVLWERHLGEAALAPMSIFKSRSMFAFHLLSLPSVYFNHIHPDTVPLPSTSSPGSRFFSIPTQYIPIFYQAAKHNSPVSSGLHLLPFILSVALTSLIVGQVVSKIGYYWPFLAVAPIFLGVGSGLLYSLEVNTSEAKLIGFQILSGIGTGLGIQNALLAIQVEFHQTPKLVGQAMSMGSFAQFLGGTLGLAVAEPVFTSQLSKYLLRYAPDAPATVVRQSPTSIYMNLPQAMIPGVVHAYTASLKIVFLVGVPVAFLALVSAVFISNLKIMPAESGSRAVSKEGPEV
ncbi:ABC transporter [Mycena vulgaris]|nr:ABC transporter [Mycena vulgaris]